MHRNTVNSALLNVADISTPPGRDRFSLRIEIACGTHARTCSGIADRQNRPWWGNHMKQNARKTMANRKLPTPPVISDLLIPIAAFLRRAGTSKSQLMSEWKVAIQSSSRPKRELKVVKIGFEHLGSTTISRWLRDPKYLNHAGRPDDLPVRGNRSITSLLKEGGVKRPAKEVISLLLELGTITKVATSRYRLIRRSMNYTIPEYLPFEPNFRFLVDAARACTWGSGVSMRSPRLFWLNAYSTRVHHRHTADFLRFAKERGLSFMHEINDWLEAHEMSHTARAPSRAKLASMRRLGMGLHGICCDPT